MKILSEAGLAYTLHGEYNIQFPPRVVSGSHSATPREALEVIDSVYDEYNLCIPNAQKGIPTREGVTLETIFIGPGMRKHPHRYFPVRLSMAPDLFEDTLTPDIVVFQVAVDHHTGLLSLGTEVNMLPAAIEAVKERGGLVIAQINKQMPYTYGDGEISDELVDYAILTDVPLDSIPPIPVSATADAIAANIAELIPDGATLCAGIGAVPDTAFGKLTGSNYRVWAEMFSDGVMKLAQNGQVNIDSFICASFAFGSLEFYKWLDHNRRVRMLRTEEANSPACIANQPKMVFIGSAMQVDLNGHANASYVNGQPYSGFGGQTDFIVGAMHSKGGMAIMALPSWHPKAHVSTIVRELREPATSFQHSFVVTEHGTAKIFGNDAVTQAAELVSVADPRARAQLSCNPALAGLIQLRSIV